MKLQVDFENETEVSEFMEYITYKELFRKFMSDFNEFVKKEQTHAKNVNNALKAKIEAEKEKLNAMEEQIKNIDEVQKKALDELQEKIKGLGEDDEGIKVFGLQNEL